MRRLGGIALIVVLVVCTCAVGGVAYQYVALRRQAVAAWPEAAARKHLDDFLKDRAALARSGLFASPPRWDRDASAFLNPRLRWDGPKEQVEAWNARADANPLFRIPDEVRDGLQKLGKKWPEYPIDPGRTDIRMDGFHDLQRFDSWSVEQDRPIALSLLAATPPSPTAFPTPEMHWLLPLCKLRLLRGLAQGDLPGASADVRRLAQLLATQQRLVSTLLAVAVLDLESQLAEHLRERHDARLDARWSPISPELLRRARRYFWAYPAFFDHRAPPDLSARVFAGADSSLGFCNAFGENALTSAFIRPFLVHAHEKEFARQKPILERARHECAHAPSLIRYADPTYVPPELDTPDFFAMTDLSGAARPPGIDTVSAQRVLATPIIREMVGYTLLQMGTPALFRHYEPGP